MSLKILPVAAIALVAATAPANASNVNFRFNSGELETLSGAQKLYQRIESKAHSACADKDKASPTRIQALIRKCESALVEEWVGKINDPRLHRIHAAAKNQREYASRN